MYYCMPCVFQQHITLSGSPIYFFGSLLLVVFQIVQINVIAQRNSKEEAEKKIKIITQRDVSIEGLY